MSNDRCTATCPEGAALGVWAPCQPARFRATLGTEMQLRTFDLLTPHVVMSAVESAFGIQLDGSLVGYPSYVNRVYGITAQDGNAYVVKFYRPGRWTAEAIAEEHQFVLDCAAMEVPVVAPIADPDGETLITVEAADGTRQESFAFALYPRRGGRSFDADRDEDWKRLGSLVGRIHVAAAARAAHHRLACVPDRSTATFIEELRSSGVVHPKASGEFFSLAQQCLDAVTGLFDGVRLQRVHGDCHRGNILDRPGEGLLIIDFDDMMMGPAVQDLWLLLPDRASESRRELELILEGYEEFRPVDHGTLGLIEPLRLMRMLYYLAWSARQRDDRRFRESFPGWGSEAFWLQEIEDLTSQLQVIREELEG